MIHLSDVPGTDPLNVLATIVYRGEVVGGGGALQRYFSDNRCPRALAAVCTAVGFAHQTRDKGSILLPAGHGVAEEQVVHLIAPPAVLEASYLEVALQAP